jgi:hypothetical protein
VPPSACGTSSRVGSLRRAGTTTTSTTTAVRGGTKRPPKVRDIGLESQPTDASAHERDAHQTDKSTRPLVWRAEGG